MSSEQVKLLREINEKLDLIISKLEALENRILEFEEPEEEDVKAYEEAERELKERKLIPLEKLVKE